MSEIITIKHLLANTASISKKYEEIAKITGDNFNIFSVLSLERREVKTHSAFLAELLNPNGSHGLGNIPLKIFTSYIKSKTESDLILNIVDKFDLDFTSCKIEVEKYEGIINEDYTEGGRIDIIIKDCNGKCILIENKIDAYEQPNQLIRYNNAYPSAPILFLTLYGDDPVSADKLKKDDHYFLISYEKDIIYWLKLCLKEAVEYPMLREVIKQYMNLIKKITNQTENNKMKEEIRNLITEDVVDSIEILNAELQKIIFETREKFFNALKEKFNNPVIFEDGSKKIYVSADDDSDGIYIGYQYYDGTEKINNSQKGKEYTAMMKEIKGNMSNSEWFFAWYIPTVLKSNKRFEDFDRKEVLKMYKDENYFKEIIDKICDEERVIRNKFLHKINS